MTVTNPFIPKVGLVCQILFALFSNILLASLQAHCDNDSYSQQSNKIMTCYNYLELNTTECVPPIKYINIEYCDDTMNDAIYHEYIAYNVLAVISNLFCYFVVITSIICIKKRIIISFYIIRLILLAVNVGISVLIIFIFNYVVFYVLESISILITTLIIWNIDKDVIILSNNQQQV
jgi:hypothetical protein